MSVLVAIPLNWPFVPTPFVNSLLNMIPDFPAGTEVKIISGSNIASIRNNIAKYFLESDHLKVLQLDADMVYPKDTLSVLDSYDVDMVQVLVPFRGNPWMCVVFEAADPKNDLDYNHKLRAISCREGIVETHSIGAGGVLTKRCVFEAMDPPYYHYDSVKHAEDVFFSVNARRLGFKCFVSMDVVCSHLTSAGITAEPPQSLADNWEIAVQYEGW